MLTVYSVMFQLQTPQAESVFPVCRHNAVQTAFPDNSSLGADLRQRASKAEREWARREPFETVLASLSAALESANGGGDPAAVAQVIPRSVRQCPVAPCCTACMFGHCFFFMSFLGALVFIPYTPCRSSISYYHYVCITDSSRICAASFFHVWGTRSLLCTGSIRPGGRFPSVLQV